MIQQKFDLSVFDMSGNEYLDENITVLQVQKYNMKDRKREKLIPR